MKKLIFRFDIDTHKCIRDGVPNLLEIAEENDIVFSFFLNTGKSISFIESIKDIVVPVLPGGGDIKLLSAREKLGVKDYLEAALLNPILINYTKPIKQIIASNCELGIHGGRNHACWCKYAMKWNEIKIEEEIKFALNNIWSIDSSYKPGGFASPGWVSPKHLLKILKKKGFKYCADYRCLESADVINTNRYMNYIGVNLLGEPGGVAFFENCRARGMNTNEIIKKVVNFIELHETTVIYDHPYYSGIREIDTIKEIINYSKSNNIDIVTLEKLI